MPVGGVCGQVSLTQVTGHELAITVGIPESASEVSSPAHVLFLQRGRPPPSLLLGGKQGCQLPGTKHGSAERGILHVAFLLTVRLRTDPTPNSACCPQVQEFQDGMFTRGVR